MIIPIPILAFLIIIVAAVAGALGYWAVGHFLKWSNPVCYGIGLFLFGLILAFGKIT